MKFSIILATLSSLLLTKANPLPVPEPMPQVSWAGSLGMLGLNAVIAGGTAYPMSYFTSMKYAREGQKQSLFSFQKEFGNSKDALEYNSQGVEDWQNLAASSSDSPLLNYQKQQLVKDMEQYENDALTRSKEMKRAEMRAEMASKVPFGTITLFAGNECGTHQLGPELVVQKVTHAVEPEVGSKITSLRFDNPPAGLVVEFYPDSQPSRNRFAKLIIKEKIPSLEICNFEKTVKNDKFEYITSGMSAGELRKHFKYVHIEVPAASASTASAIPSKFNSSHGEPSITQSIANEEMFSRQGSVSPSAAFVQKTQ